jgi:tetratricopeptide (TPR) repeat protein
VITEFCHYCVCGGLLADRAGFVAGLGLPPMLTAPVDAHARLRGPYTAGGAIIRVLTAAALRRDPGLARRHDIEIRALAPELRGSVPVAREALAEAVPPEQRTRIYPRLRTVRLAHGLTDFLRDYLIGLADAPRSLVIENLWAADQTDRELVAVLLRRLDPALLTIVACGAGERLGVTGRRRGGQPATDRDPLEDAIAAHARSIQLPQRRPEAAHVPGTAHLPGPAATAGADLATRFVHGDCVSDEPAQLAAYARLSPASRARLHDGRADDLERDGWSSAWLGALPYHRERGTDPAGRGVRALTQAAELCFSAGFHHAAADLGQRGRALVTPAPDLAPWWHCTFLAAGSLTALGRGAEAQALYDEARAACTDPAVHRVAAYETAMLYTRHHGPGLLDPARALPWINEAIALAGLLADPAGRAFHLAFTKNGRALVDMRLGNPRGALDLVEEGLALLAIDVPAGSHPLDRCSLHANRARVLAFTGQLADALAEHDELIALDPTYGEYHFERGNLLHLLHRDEDALACYASAQQLSLPFPELHYNRADLLIARGDEDGALAELDRALELAPDFVTAYVNRAGILAGRGEHAAAVTDVAAGLARDPGNAYLLCIRGQIEAAEDRPAAARVAFDAAITANPGLAAAWASRAALEFAAGDPDAAVADLSRALEQGEDAVLLFNRATALRMVGRFDAAKDDANRALALGPADDAATLALLADLAHCGP